jgi:hypothetical protein
VIQKFVDRFIAAEPEVRAKLAEAHTDEYKSLVKLVIQTVANEDDGYGQTPSPDRIHEIDDGDYQGTYLYVIASTGYQPDDYWFVKVSYGSCSGCDTLQAISGYSDEKPTEEQVNDYWTLCLHIVQGLRELGGEVV